MSLTKVLILMIVFHTLVLYSLASNVCLPFSQQLVNLECVINYQICSEYLNVIKFSSCAKRYCEEYDDKSEDEYQCIIWNAQNLDEQMCLSSCCKISYVISTVFTPQIMNTCIQFNQKQGVSGLTIGLAVGFGVFGLPALVLLIICCVRRIRRQNQSHQTSIQLVQKPLTNQLSLNLTQTCSICLNSRTNCITICGHSYHIQCIGEWIKKSQKCPNCKTDKMNPIKIFCQICTKQCSTIQTDGESRFKYLRHNWFQFLKNNKIVCKDCQQQTRFYKSNYSNKKNCQN